MRWRLAMTAAAALLALLLLALPDPAEAHPRPGIAATQSSHPTPYHDGSLPDCPICLALVLAAGMLPPTAPTVAAPPPARPLAVAPGLPRQTIVAAGFRARAPPLPA